MAQLTKREVIEMLGEDGVSRIQNIPSLHGKYSVAVIENYLRTYRVFKDNHFSTTKGINLQGVDITTATLEKALKMSGYSADSVGITGAKYYTKDKIFLATLLYKADKALKQKVQVSLLPELAKYIGVGTTASPYMVMERSRTKYSELFEQYTFGDIHLIYGVEYKEFQEAVQSGLIGKSENLLHGTKETLYFKEEVDKYFYNVHFDDNTLRTKNFAKSIIYERSHADYHYATEVSMLNGVSIDTVKTFPCYIYEIGNKLIYQYLYSADNDTRACAKQMDKNKNYISYDEAKKLLVGCKNMSLNVLAEVQLIEPYIDAKNKRLFFSESELADLITQYHKEVKSNHYYVTLRELENILNISDARIKRVLQDNKIEKKFRIGVGEYVYNKSKALKPFTSSDFGVYSVNKTAVELGITVSKLAQLTELGYIDKKGSGYTEEDVKRYKEEYGVNRSDYKSLGWVSHMLNVAYSELLGLLENNKLTYSYKEPDTGVYFLSPIDTDKVKQLLSCGTVSRVLINNK